MGNICRTGFFIDGRFAWLDDGAWQRKFAYHGDSLVSDVMLSHPGLGITVNFEDFIDLARNWYIGNTVLFDPRHRGVIAYKANRYFLLGGQCGPEYGISSWANGKKGNGAQGTWVDAEDGVLGKHPIEQGAVDCTICFDLGQAAAGEPRTMTHWLCMGTRLSEVTAYGQDLIVGRGADTYRARTRTYWQVWSEKDHRHLDGELGDDATKLYRRSVLTARSHVDNRGAVIASTDFDITKFARDTYAYHWPRDGA